VPPVFSLNRPWLSGPGEEYESADKVACAKATHDREEGTSRTDFIAAARRAARTAQKELHGSEANPPSQ